MIFQFFSLNLTYILVFAFALIDWQLQAGRLSRGAWPVLHEISVSYSVEVSLTLSWAVLQSSSSSGMGRSTPDE